VWWTKNQIDYTKIRCLHNLEPCKSASCKPQTLKLRSYCLYRTQIRHGTHAILHNQPQHAAEFKTDNKTNSCDIIIHITAWSRVLLEMLRVTQPVKKIPTSYGTQRSVTVFTRSHHLPLSWATLIQSTPSHPISLRSILILFSHLHLELLSGLCPSGFLTKILYAFLMSPMHATCPPISSSLILSP